MTKLPISIGTIHFTGIGGIGMSGIAEILFEMGYHVQGSDISENNNIIRLRGKGIKIIIPQKSSNLIKVSLLVISTAIKNNNVELLEARKKMIPIVHRSEMLGELMRLRWSIAIAGTHGKTTTTSLIATIFENSGMDPTVINGGIISSWGSNAKLGSGDWLIAEADESDGSFAKLNPTVAIVTNIDSEHLDYYENFSNLEKAFLNFISSIPFYGFATLCIDNPNVRKLVTSVSDRKIITYGISNDADIRAINIKNDHQNMYFNVSISKRLKKVNEKQIEFKLPMLGNHNVKNCLASIAVAIEMGIELITIKQCLEKFSGVGRRFDIKGCIKGITIIDDYAHHPEEIKVTLAAARLYCPKGKIIAVFQPHRFSRLKNLFHEFCQCFYEANILFVADVYSAGEKLILGYEKNNLIMGLKENGHLGIHDLDDSNKLHSYISKIANHGDLVICLGAGSITNWSNELIEKLSFEN